MKMVIKVASKRPVTFEMLHDGDFITLRVRQSVLGWHDFKVSATGNKQAIVRAMMAHIQLCAEHM